MLRFKSLFVSVVGIGILFVAAGLSQAAPITIPTGLNPGDQYRLVFLTEAEEQIFATSSDIEVYNSFVFNGATAVPELAALGTTWKAIASTASVDARDNTNTLPSFAGGSLGVPIYRLDGAKVVNSYDDLWDGSIIHRINITENGNLSVTVHTPSNSFGAGSPLK